jgi:hypothetical protein
MPRPAQLRGPPIGQSYPETGSWEVGTATDRTYNHDSRNTGYSEQQGLGLLTFANRRRAYSPRTPVRTKKSVGPTNSEEGRVPCRRKSRRLNRASPDFIVDEQSSLEPKIHFTFGAFAKSPRGGRPETTRLHCDAINTGALPLCRSPFIAPSLLVQRSPVDHSGRSSL